MDGSIFHLFEEVNGIIFLITERRIVLNLRNFGR